MSFITSSKSNLKSLKFKITNNTNGTQRTYSNCVMLKNMAVIYGNQYFNGKKLKMELDKQEKYFKILYTKKVEGIISEDEFLEKYNVHQNKINEIKEELNRLGKKNKMQNFPKQVNKLIIDFSDTKKFDNTLLKKFVEKIEVNRNNKIDIFLKV